MQSWPLKWLVAAATATVVLVVVLIQMVPSAEMSQLIGDIGLFLAVVTAFVSCTFAARRTPEERRAWGLPSCGPSA
jgi:hypothetical protein